MIQLLQIDDDPFDQRLLAEALRETNVPIELRHESNGQAAFQLLREGRSDGRSPWRPHIIICDLNMPVMNGIEFLEELKADPVLRPIPVIILSTSNLSMDVVRAYRHHANCYIRKPMEFEELCAIAKNICGFWMSTAELPSEEVA